MDQNGENRRCKRYEVGGIRGNVLNTTDVDVLNISIDGAAIETPRRLEINREYAFKIRSENSFLQIKAQVVWAVLVSKGAKGSRTATPVYRAGLKFTEVLSEKADTLRHFIEENRAEPYEHRLEGVRFTIASSNKVKLEYPYEYKVKKISLSGMLIETEYPLAPGSEHVIELFICDEEVNIVGRVVNCERSDSEPGVRYDIGIEFVTVLAEDKLILKKFLRTVH